MLLRASGEIGGTPVDVTAIRDDAAAQESGIPNAPALLAFVQAAVTHDDDSLPPARQRVLDEMGAKKLVDSAAVIGNFQRMTRIADSTGIPLDGPMNALSAGVQEDLGLRDFRSSANSARPGVIAATVAGALRPLIFRGVGMVAERMKRKRQA